MILHERLLTVRDDRIDGWACSVADGHRFQTGIAEISAS